MSLKEKRRARRKEQIEAYTDNERKVYDILEKITPDIFIHFPNIESSLIEDGEIVYSSDDFRMQHYDPMFKALGKIKLTKEDKVSNIDSRVYLEIINDNGISIASVTPNPSYILSEIKNRLRERDVTMRFCSEGINGCEVCLSITGEK